MPESEHKPIETLLRSAAAKRRHEAGSPEMHPATRETLLTEVRRQYGAAAGRSTRPWWMRLAPALAVLVLLAGGTWMVLRNEPSSTLELARLDSSDSRQNALEKVSANELSGEVTLNVPQQEADEPAPTPMLGVAAFEPTEQPVRQPAYPVNGAAPDTPPRTDLALAPTPTSTGRAGTFADAASREVAKAEEPQTLAPPAAEVAGRFESASSSLRLGTEEEAARKPQTATSGDDVGEVSQSVNGVTVPVLQNFVVATREERVWFIDEDGSVYEGRMEHAPSRTAPATSDSQGKVVGVNTDSLAAAPVERRAAAVQTVSYTFDASGINQSLRRSIRFTGQMVLTEQQARQDRNAFANTLPPAQQRVQAGQQSYGLPSAGVDGTLQMDDGTTLRVQAVPAPR